MCCDLAVVVAQELYAAILDHIEAQGYNVFSCRAKTSLPYKLQVAAACAARDPKELTARLRGGGKPGDADGRIAIPG